MNQPYSGYKRIACSTPCTIKDTEGVRAGVVWNLSVVGAYVVGGAMPRAGGHIHLSFSLPEDPAPIGARARVVWANRPSLWSGCGERAATLPPGFGLEFIGLEAADRARIEMRVRGVFPESDLTPHLRAHQRSSA